MFMSLLKIKHPSKYIYISLVFQGLKEADWLHYYPVKRYPNQQLFRRVWFL